MATEVGVGYISIVPEVKGFSDALKRELGPGLGVAGQQAGAQVGRGVVDGADDAVRKNKRRLSDTGGMISGLLMGGALASAAIFGKSLVDAASRQEQALGALDAVFKGNAAQMRANAAESTKLGLSTSAYAEAATSLGAQLQNLGMAQTELAPTSHKLVTLAADMAAQFGGTVPEAVAALTSALRGEMDPIERYGVSLNETALKAQMSATGQDKMRASLSLIQTQLGNTGTIGAWNRELDTTASKTQIASANWENAKAKLGDLLTPIVAWAAGEMAKLLETFTKMDPATRNLIMLVAGLTAGVFALLWAVSALNLSMLANPMTWVILAIIAVVVVLAALLWDLWRKSETFRASVKNLWDDLRKWWREHQPQIQELKQKWNELRQEVEKAFDYFVREVWPILKQALPYVFTALKFGISSLIFGMKLLRAEVGFLVDILQKALDLIKQVQQSDPSKATAANPQGRSGAGWLAVPGDQTIGRLKRATGGPVPGIGSRDSVPALLTPGEYVSNTRMVDQAGGVTAMERWRLDGILPGGVNVGSLVINNPTPERASESLPRAIRKLSYVGSV